MNIQHKGCGEQIDKTQFSVLLLCFDIGNQDKFKIKLQYLNSFIKIYNTAILGIKEVRTLKTFLDEEKK